MNDSHVTQVSVQKVQQAQAYLLFYSSKGKPGPPETPVPPASAPATTTTKVTNGVAVPVDVPSAVEKKKVAIVPDVDEDKASKVRFSNDTTTTASSATAVVKKNSSPSSTSSAMDVENDDQESDDDEEEEDEELPGSDLESDLEDDMGDADEDHDFFPALYCNEVYRYVAC